MKQAIETGVEFIGSLGYGKGGRIVDDLKCAAHLAGRGEELLAKLSTDLGQIAGKLKTAYAAVGATGCPEADELLGLRSLIREYRSYTRDLDEIGSTASQEY